MNLKPKQRLYALTDDENIGTCNFYYIENGNVKKQPLTSFNNTPNNPFLQHSPIGWKDEEIDFATSEQFKSLQRGFNIGLQFVYEGATIARSRQYFGRGCEETMYLIILKWNRSDDKYYLEYKGKLDFNTSKDSVGTSITINSIEGGVLSYLNANKDTAYEIQIDESNPAWKLIYLDGMNLSETLNYSFIDADLDGGRYVVPLVFINNEGDHEDVLYGNPLYESVANPYTYFPGSNNYLIQNVGSNSVTFTFAGILKLDGIDSNGLTGVYRMRYAISDDTTLLADNAFVSIPFPTGPVSVSFSQTITLLPGQKLFWYHLNTFNTTTSGGTIYYAVSDFKISFTSRKAATESFCIRLYDYWKQLVLKLTDGKYTGESAYLASRTDLVCTCGDALRNTDRTVIPNYLLSSSLSDFFQSIPGSLSAGSSCGIYARNNILYCELLSDIYSDAAPLYDLGEVSAFSINAANITTNTINAGYPNQTYDSNGGKYEFNAGQVWQEPVLSVNKSLDIASKWRADARGIEAIRSKYTHLDTTDNSGDKEPFIIQISQQQLTEDYRALTNPAGRSYTGQNWLIFDGALAGNYMTTDSNKYIFTFNGNRQKANVRATIYINNSSHNVQIILFKNGQSVGIYTGSATDGLTAINLSDNNANLSLNDNYEIQVTPFDTSFQNYTIVSAELYFDFLIKPYTLLRLPYTSITGVLDNTVYNVELRPRNQILWHGNEIHEMLAQQDGYDITLLSSDKNVQLSTTINGITETENAPIHVSDLARPLGLPYDFEFTTEVPYTFSDLLSMSTTGYFSFIANGIQFYALPRGNMKSTPATNGAQTWTLRAAAKNLLSDLFRVSNNDYINFEFDKNMIATSIYNPFHLVKYGYTPQAKYHQIDMFEDWSYQRFNDWFMHGRDIFYAQPWQTTDIGRCPIISSGLGQLSYFIYDVDGNEYLNGLFTIITTPYVRSPYTLQEADIDFSTFDEGLYTMVIKAGSTNVWITEWMDIKNEHLGTFLMKTSNSKNELNLPWLAYNGELEFRFHAIFEPVEDEITITEYEDDRALFSVLNSETLYKRNMIVVKSPEWLALKVNACTAKDKCYIEGETSDSTKHYTRRSSSQMEKEKFVGHPYANYTIELLFAEGLLFLVNKEVPFNDNILWHTTIDAQVLGADYQDTELSITED